MRIVLLLISLFALALEVPACTGARVVQAAVEPYSVEASVTIKDGAGAEVTKGVWFNSRFIAIDFDTVHGQLVLRGPEVYDGPIVELRRFEAGTNTGRHVWEIVLPSRSGERTQLVPSSWEAARASMRHMPG